MLSVEDDVREGGRDRDGVGEERDYREIPAVAYCQLSNQGVSLRFAAPFLAHSSYSLCTQLKRQPRRYFMQ